MGFPEERVAFLERRRRNKDLKRKQRDPKLRARIGTDAGIELRMPSKSSLNSTRLLKLNAIRLRQLQKPAFVQSKDKPKLQCTTLGRAAKQRFQLGFAAGLVAGNRSSFELGPTKRHSRASSLMPIEIH